MSQSLFALPAELAKPVVQGYLPKTQAQATLMAAALRAFRLGELQGSDQDPFKTFDLLNHLLEQHIGHWEHVRAQAEGDARRAQWDRKRREKQS